MCNTTTATRVKVPALVWCVPEETLNNPHNTNTRHTKQIRDDHNFIFVVAVKAADRFSRQHLKIVYSRL